MRIFPSWNTTPRTSTLGCGVPGIEGEQVEHPAGAAPDPWAIISAAMVLIAVYRSMSYGFSAKVKPVWARGPQPACPFKPVRFHQSASSQGVESKPLLGSGSPSCFMGDRFYGHAHPWASNHRSSGTSSSPGGPRLYPVVSRFYCTNSIQTITEISGRTLVTLTDIMH